MFANRSNFTIQFRGFFKVVVRKITANFLCLRGVKSCELKAARNLLLSLQTLACTAKWLVNADTKHSVFIII